MAAIAAAAGVRVVKQSCLAHGLVEAGLYLSRFAAGDEALGKWGEFGISCGRLVRGASPCYSPSTARPQFRIRRIDQMKTLAHFLCGVLCLSAVAQDHSSHDHTSHAKEH